MLSLLSGIRDLKQGARHRAGPGCSSAERRYAKVGFCECRVTGSTPANVRKSVIRNAAPAHSSACQMVKKLPSAPFSRLM